MARKKYDGVIEAVRYDRDGKINVVRTYLRHGAVWSDHIIMGRNVLVDKINQGKHFAIGDRIENMGNEFDTRAAVHLVKGHVITEGQAAARDMLAGLSVF